MAIHLNKNSSSVNITITDKQSWLDFKVLVQRGSNLWPDAPPKIKEFADLVTNGEVLQDYRSQDTSQKNTQKKD